MNNTILKPIFVDHFFKYVPSELLENNEASNTIIWELLTRLEKILNENSQFYIHDSNQNNIIIQNSIVHPSVSIAPFSIIKHSFISEGVKIGSFCEISRSIMLKSSKAGRSDYIGRSIIGSNVTVSGNVRTATRRMDLDYPRIKEIDLYSPFKRIGCFVGDNSFLASTIHINPFTFICPNTNVYPFQSLKGIVENE